MFFTFVGRPVKKWNKILVHALVRAWWNLFRFSLQQISRDRIQSRSFKSISPILETRAIEGSLPGWILRSLASQEVKFQLRVSWEASLKLRNGKRVFNLIFCKESESSSNGGHRWPSWQWTCFSVDTDSRTGYSLSPVARLRGALLFHLTTSVTLRVRPQELVPSERELALVKWHKRAHLYRENKPGIRFKVRLVLTASVSSLRAG